MQRRTLLSSLMGVVLIGPWPESFANAPQITDRPKNVILVTGGDFVRYRHILLAFAQGLQKLGLIDEAPVGLEYDRIDTEDVWTQLAEYAGGRSLRFLADGHYNYRFDDAERQRAREEVLNRIKEKGDVDIVLTFGTEPGLDMAQGIHDIPILSLGSSDPVRTGMVPCAEDSGQDNLHVLVRQNFYAEQITAFHAILPFRKLALVVAESDVAKSGEAEIRERTRRLGAQFALVTYPDDGHGDARNFDFIMQAVKKAADEGSDAIVFHWFRAMPHEFKALTKFLTEHEIAGFAQSGSEFVARGLLLGAGNESFEGYGMFEAKVLEKVLAGVKPRSIGQVFAERSRLVLNLATAAQMGWVPPFGVLVAVEEAYTTQR